jgi:hypothetical protein
MSVDQYRTMLADAERELREALVRVESLKVAAEQAISMLEHSACLDVTGPVIRLLRRAVDSQEPPA